MFHVEQRASPSVRPIVSKGSAAAIGIGLFVGGVAVGLFLARCHAPAVPPDPSPAVRSRTPTQEPRPDPATTPTPEVEALRRRIRDLEAEREVCEVPRNEVSAPSPGFAALVFRDYLRMNVLAQKMEPELLRELLGRLGRLDEQSAGFFIQKFREARNDPAREDERRPALELLLACGGPDVADFVNVLLHDQSLAPSLRSHLIDEVSGRGIGLFSIRRLPVDDALAASARDLLRSPEAREREGGAALLGGHRTEASRVELRRILEQDPSREVRAVAARSLGTIGDPATRNYLEQYLARNGARFRQEEGGQVPEAIEAAIRDLSGEK